MNDSMLNDVRDLVEIHAAIDAEFARLGMVGRSEDTIKSYACTVYIQNKPRSQAPRPASGGAGGYNRPAPAASAQAPAAGGSLGNCPKCGAEMKLSKQGNPYCSATCWKA